MRHLTCVVAVACIAAPAFAAVTVGTTVKDTAGAIVGTVASAADGNIVVDTGKNKVTIPETSFTTTPDGLLLAMTKVQLDTAYETAVAEQKAKLAAAVTPGASLRGSQGGVLGTITKVDGEFVMVKGEAGQARIPAANLTLQSDGLHFDMTAAQFAEAIKASMPSDNPTI